MLGKISAVTLLVTLLLITVPAHATVQYDFDSDLEGWTTEDWGYGEPTLQWVELNGGCLEADTSSMNIGPEPSDNWGKAFLKGDFSSAQDLTSEPIYKLDIYIPSNIYSAEAQLCVRGGDGWDIVESGVWESLSNETWNAITWDMTGISNLDDVRQLGVQVQGWMPPTPGGVAKFNIDNVETQAIPEPSSLLLFTTGLTGLLGLTIRKKQSYLHS